MPATGRRNPLAEALAAFTRDTAGRGNWGHPGLAKMLRAMSVEEASWKPAPDAHSIWEEVNHIAYWSRVVLDHLEGRGRSAKQAWPAGEGGEAAWRKAVTDVSKLHARLVLRIIALKPSGLNTRYRSSRYTMTQLLLGCASHIAYHVGQVALLRRLYRNANRPV